MKNIGRTKSFPPGTGGPKVLCVRFVTLATRFGRNPSQKKRALESGPSKAGSLHPRRRYDRGAPGEASVTASTLMFSFTSPKLLLWTRKKRFLSFVLLCAAASWPLYPLSLSTASFLFRFSRLSLSFTITSLRRRWNTKVLVGFCWYFLLWFKVFFLDFVVKFSTCFPLFLFCFVVIYFWL